MGNLVEPNDAPRRCHRCRRTLRGRQACDCIRIVDPPPAARRYVAEPDPEFRDDWAEDVGTASDVRGQLARWRRIREGSWVRRRVMTGEAGPLAPPVPQPEPTDSGAAPNAERARPALSVCPDPEPGPEHPPARAERPRFEPDELPRTVVVLGPGAPTIEDTSEVVAVPAELQATYDAPTRGSRTPIVMVALALTLAAAGVTWAIVVLY